MIVYFESTHRPGVRYKAIGKDKGVVKLQDAEGNDFELPMQILREQGYRLVKENDNGKKCT